MVQQAATPATPGGKQRTPSRSRSPPARRTTRASARKARAAAPKTAPSPAPDDTPVDVPPSTTAARTRPRATPRRRKASPAQPAQQTQAEHESASKDTARSLTSPSPPKRHAQGGRASLGRALDHHGGLRSLQPHHTHFTRLKERMGHLSDALGEMMWISRHGRSHWNAVRARLDEIRSLAPKVSTDSRSTRTPAFLAPLVFVVSLLTKILFLPLILLRPLFYFSQRKVVAVAERFGVTSENVAMHITTYREMATAVSLSVVLSVSLFALVMYGPWATGATTQTVNLPGVSSSSTVQTLLVPQIEAVRRLARETETRRAASESLVSRLDRTVEEAVAKVNALSQKLESSATKNSVAGSIDQLRKELAAAMEQAESDTATALHRQYESFQELLEKTRASSKSHPSSQIDPVLVREEVLRALENLRNDEPSATGGVGDVALAVEKAIQDRSLSESELQKVQAAVEDATASESFRATVRAIARAAAEGSVRDSEDRVADLVRETITSNETLSAILAAMEPALNERVALSAGALPGVADYALSSAGASVVSYAPAYPTWADRVHWNIRSAVFGFLRAVGGSTLSSGLVAPPPPHFPSVILERDNPRGRCWAFAGNAAEVTIMLSERIEIDSFTVMHIAASAARDISSAPRSVELLGLGERGALADAISLGTFEYSTKGSPTQRFFVSTDLPADLRRHSFVTVRIRSNHGHPEYTCVYGVGIHGSPASSA